MKSKHITLIPVPQRGVVKVNFYQRNILKMNSSENFAFQSSLGQTQARKASYIPRTQKDFGPESENDSVEKLLLDMNCCSFVFSREKSEL